tara:strand:- start:221 stop:904 length:684 start_codon:yes stop_codon:yes gene_type:complete
MHQQIDKKIKLSIYILLLFLLSTINNLSLNNSEHLKLQIKSIYVNGLTDEKNLQVSKDLSNLIFQNIFFIDKKYFENILEKNNLIKSFNVKKIYPNSIEIKIKKTEFLGISFYNGEKFFIGSNGKLIKFEPTDKNLPLIYNLVNIEYFIDLKKIVDESQLNFNEISEIYFFPSGRCDIKLKNKILLKLPNKNLLKSLNFAFEIIKHEKFKSNEIIDLRIANYFISKK